MSVRLRVILIITFTNLLIILFSIFTGMQFVSRNIDEAQETDMRVVADMADRFISSEIEALRLKASNAAELLDHNSGGGWDAALSGCLETYPEFTGFAVFDAQGTRIAAAGEKPAPPDAVTSTHIASAFDGAWTLANTYFYGGIPAPDPGVVDANPDYNFDSVVFYGAVRLPYSADKILAVTLPGMHFHELLLPYQIWDTGHIFMLDPQGTFVSNPRAHWVYQRLNSPRMAALDPEFDSYARTAALMAGGHEGIGYYTVFGVPRVCAYKPVSGSDDGWSLGTVAPLPESPFRNVNRVLLIVGTIGFSLGAIIAVFASGIIKKPFEQVKVLQKEAELNSQYKSQFLANMSHEMRTPLTSVIGLTELTLRTVYLDKNTHDNLVKVYRAGETLLGLINDILDISKIEANRFELNQSEYDFPSILNDTITQSLLYVGEKPVEFILDITEDLPRRLYGDELRVKQIFNNLLSNAFKYTREGTVELNVRCEREGDTVWLTARVTDTGIGIKPEDFDKLFTLYANMDKENKKYDGRRIEGTGLGLSICKRIAEMMDGNISVQSIYGKGSVFTVRFRQKHVDDYVIGNDVVESLRKFHYTIDKFKNTEKTRIGLDYARVLVVDDNTANLDVAKGLLSLYGMKVDCVTSGRTAVDIIQGREHKYNAVFMDHMMPEIDGIEAARLIREIGTDYAKNIPIIALTANAVAGNEEMFLSKGFQAFLAKPIDMTELDAVLKKWVRDKDAESLLAAQIYEGGQLPGEDMQSGNAGAQHSGAGAHPGVQSDKDINIPGIDSDGLKARYQNEPRIYLSVLRSFAENAASLVEKLRDVTEDTLEEYCINVHGLKGISANISAAELSSEAAKLEELSKSGNISGIPERNKALLEKTSALIAEINAWLAEDTDGGISGADASMQYTLDPEVLKRLLQCCERFDIEGADKAMEEIEGKRYETGSELVSWLRDKLTDSQFVEIADRLKSILRAEL